MINVELVYALKDRQKVIRMAIEEGCTLQAAIENSGLLAEFPEIDLGKNKLGIWNKLAKPDAVLRDHDRVEIYRPLIADPKEVRKQRAAEGKAMKKGGGEAGGGTLEIRQRKAARAGLLHFGGPIVGLSSGQLIEFHDGLGFLQHGDAVAGLGGFQNLLVGGLGRNPQGVMGPGVLDCNIGLRQRGLGLRTQGRRDRRGGLPAGRAATAGRK